MAENLLASIRRVGIRNYRAVALDKEARDRLSRYGHPVDLFPANVWQTYQNFGTPGFCTVTGLKWRILQTYLAWGDVFYLDADIYLWRDPMDAVDVNADITIQTDSYDTPLSNLCTGCIFFRSTRRSRRLLKLLVSHLPGLPVNPSAEDDQFAFNEAYRNRDRLGLSDMKLEVFDPDLFPNGDTYFHRGRRHSKAYLIHPNWTIGLENKIRLLAGIGAWSVTSPAYSAKNHPEFPRGE